jgi:FGGY-family pentulose kinase
MNQSQADFAEHNSEDIWAAVCKVVKKAVALSGVKPEQITGIGFDATCSLVLRDKAATQISVATSGDVQWDTICWLDHRALREADECTATGHRVLDHIGGVMSPEMEIPKLMWVKRNMPDTWRNLGLAFDLADFLTWKASGSLARSQCTLACKWTFLPHESTGWQSDFLEKVGLGDLVEKADLPSTASPVGSSIGRLSPDAADSLGLTTDCQVGTGLIDAYGGAIGVLGAFAQNDGTLDTHLALIAGTSSCVMTMSHESRLTHGVWGPYFGAGLPDFWINEGGQSATGALLDHVIRVHAEGVEPTSAMHAKIIQRVSQMRRSEGRDLAGRLHILPDFHGNRSPLADPHALGVVSGLSIDTSFDGLCKLYWRTAVSIALGVRHILDTLNANGYIIDTLHVTGGHVRNPLLMELYADATGCKVIEPVSEDATLLGTAMVAAAAACLYPSLTDACAGMYKGGRTREPDPAAAIRFDKDYAVFLAMQRHRAEIDIISNP